MKKILFFLSLLVTYNAKAQTLKLNSSFCNNMRMIEISTTNIVTLIQLPYSEFYQLMSGNNYKENSELGEGCFLNENGPAGSPYYVICKKPGEVSMMWTKKPCNMVNQVIDELEPYFYKSIDGFSIYRISSNRTNYTLTLQTQGDKGSITITRN